MMMIVMMVLTALNSEERGSSPLRWLDLKRCACEFLKSWKRVPQERAHLKRGEIGSRREREKDCFILLRLEK